MLEIYCDHYRLHGALRSLIPVEFAAIKALKGSATLE
jgi:hypothetical protein